MELLSTGTVALVQNQIYALTPNKVTLFTDATTPVIQHSTTAGFTANVAVTLTAGQADVAGGFLRTTSAGVTVCLSKA